MNKQNGCVVMITSREKIQILLSTTTALSWGIWEVKTYFH
jgi:hypothetical protein